MADQAYRVGPNPSSNILKFTFSLKLS